MTNFYLSAALALLTLTGCPSSEPDDTETEAPEEMRARELARLDEGIPAFAPDCLKLAIRRENFDLFTAPYMPLAVGWYVYTLDDYVDLCERHLWPAQIDCALNAGDDRELVGECILGGPFLTPVDRDGDGCADYGDNNHDDPAFDDRESGCRAEIGERPDAGI